MRTTILAELNNLTSHRWPDDTRVLPDPRAEDVFLVADREVAVLYYRGSGDFEELDSAKEANEHMDRWSLNLLDYW